MTASHVPVLAGELIEALDPQPGQVAIDCTFGAGGHARLVAERIGPTGTLIAIDRDTTAQAHFDAFASEVACATRFVHAPFADGLSELLAEGIRADLVYVDLGISSMQVDTWERGFSYSYDAPLDMRMDTTQELDAATVVNTWPERRIVQILRQYGDERYATQIVRAIVRIREDRTIETTSELVDIINNAIPARARFAGGHPAKRTFQAIRIAVNDELGQVDEALPLAWKILRTNGRFAGISFHSGEDRRVKQFLVERARGCVCPPELPVCVCGRTPEAELINRGVAPSAGEVASNPRSASARMRAARKLREEDA
ncbi:MAG TPA: 16S rRNA (cytosine(1402)-N(4))-methyltransferase RsmH [Baekduia sp.]